MDKDFKKINKLIIYVYRYKWLIVFKIFVFYVDKEKFLFDIEKYKLNLINLDNVFVSFLL